MAAIPRIKVCGICRREDALLARELGAWAVGFIFYPRSPRYVEPDRAGAIAAVLGDAIEKVGVFVDAEPAEITATAERAGLTIAQLHGAETPAVAEELRPRFRDVWKAIRVGASLPVSALEPFRGWTLLLDTLRADRPGGTGATFPWELARQARAYGRIVLAGGLTPDNVAEAIRTVDPFAVDVASGVEARPGQKDHDLLRRFFREVTGARVKRQ
jgi:phosphoribosylanthranilate isomerase